MAILYQREITIFNQSGNGSDLRLLYFVAVLLLINDNIEKNDFRFVCTRGDYKNMPAYGMLQIHTLN